MTDKTTLANAPIGDSNDQTTVHLMRYDISLLEDQIVYHLQQETNLDDVNIATHAGQITALYFQDAYLKEGLMKNLPFIFVQYQGKSVVDKDSTMGLDIHEVKFRFFIASQSLRATREAQLGSYDILAYLYDNLHGRYFNYTGNTYNFPLLTAPIMTVAEMNQQMPLTESDGQIEQLIVNLPDIVVYQTDYVCRMLA